MSPKPPYNLFDFRHLTCAKGSSCCVRGTRISAIIDEYGARQKRATYIYDQSHLGYTIYWIYAT